MDNNRIPESDTSLRFCEHCGCPLFDYGNVCKACGKRQSPQNSVAENGQGQPFTQSNGEASAPPHVSGLKGTAIGNKSDNRSYNDAPGNSTMPLDNNASASSLNSGWIAPSENTPPSGMPNVYNGGAHSPATPAVNPVVTPSAKPKEKGTGALVLAIVSSVLFAISTTVAIILFVNYNNQKNNADNYKIQADSAIAQLGAYQAEMRTSESEIDSYEQQISDYQQQINSYKKQLSDAQDTIDEKDHIIDIYLDDISQLEAWKDNNYLAADFTNNWVVVVFDNGSSLYHKTYCPNFESLYSKYNFWAFNIDAAMDTYYPCSKCID